MSLGLRLKNEKYWCWQILQYKGNNQWIGIQLNPNNQTEASVVVEEIQVESSVNTEIIKEVGIDSANNDDDHT